MWPSREELIREMGIDDSEFSTAGTLRMVLRCLHHQRLTNIDAKTGDKNYGRAASEMYYWIFGLNQGSYYDAKRQCIWYLNERGPDTPEDPTLKVRATFCIAHKGRCIHVWQQKKGGHSKKVGRYDMLVPKHRQRFVDVRRITTERCLGSKKYAHKATPESKYTSSPPSASRAPSPPPPGKHKDILRLQNFNALRVRSRNIPSRDPNEFKKPSPLAEMECCDSGVEADSECADIKGVIQVQETADQLDLKTEGAE